MMRDHIATSLEMTLEDLDYAPFAEAGDGGRRRRCSGGSWVRVLDELNGVLAA